MNKIQQDEFEFNEKNHTYTLNGQRMTGVTTVLSMIGGNSTGALIQWAANMASNYIEEEVRKIAQENEGLNYLKALGDNWARILTEARTAHRKKKEDAGDIGTIAHKLIERWIKNKDENYSALLDNQSEQVVKMIGNFVSWVDKNKVKFLESEKRLYSKKYFIAGTCDFVCEIDGKKYVGDIKTGGVYDRVPLAQTAAYRMMLEEMGDKDFAGSVIVNIKKDGKFNEQKNVHWGYDYKQDLRLFMGALEIYRVMNNVELVTKKVVSNKKSIII